MAKIKLASVIFASLRTKRSRVGSTAMMLAMLSPTWASNHTTKFPMYYGYDYDENGKGSKNETIDTKDILKALEISGDTVESYEESSIEDGLTLLRLKKKKATLPTMI